MNRFVYAFITNRGRALDVIFKRLKLAIDPNQQGWDEDESIRKVNPAFHLKDQRPYSPLMNRNDAVDDLILQLD